MWKNGTFLAGGDKKMLLSQVMLVRDAPNEALYQERENKLLELTSDLSVRPGQAVHTTSFREYYTKNWKNCAFQWVLAYRRNLPTKGCNDTQAVESTFSVIKRITKTEFGNRTPSISDLIMFLPRILDARSESRQKNIYSKRLVIYHENPLYRTALESASWVLNAAGLKAFNSAINMCDKKEGSMSLLENSDIQEKYTGTKTAPYVGVYTT